MPGFGTMIVSVCLVVVASIGADNWARDRREIRAQELQVKQLEDAFRRDQMKMQRELTLEQFKQCAQAGGR